MPKITMTAFTAQQERGVERIAHQVTITLNDGQKLNIERLHANGSIAIPLTDAERRSKFSGCMRWANLEPDPIHQALENLRQAHSVKTIVDTISKHLDETG